ncbi:hypothetical protein CLV86_1196 [Lacinutrix venerupis]|uniref:alpha-ketoglutarate decarboxylase n=1 Tax=Lacinutrix venerupis TaxID=1486034 RepID=UPI000EAC34B4|nr:alpha-ketoglutarate decarboxylase [Lacinutrix venerupis]RLJ65619.1 hypothetical protein CLV86_1196 [Lacinutrix venerupis]
MKISKNNSLKIIVFTLLSIFFTTSVIAQSNNAKNNFWEHVRFGGGLGLSTGNNIFSATIAPSAIYDFDSQFFLGVGLNYTYFSRKNIAKSTILGGSIIGLFNPIQEIQLSGEFEQNHVSRNFDNPAIVDDEYWVSSFFIGAGYRTNNITIGVRYDVLYDEDKSIYANAWAPFVRVYF